MKTTITILLAVGIMGLSAYILNIGKISQISQNIPEENIVKIDDETKPDEVIPAPIPPVKDNTLNIGESGDYGTVYIKPLSIEEDSRCPEDVTCIQAGTVRVNIEVTSKVGQGNSDIHIAKLGEVLETHGVKIILSKVEPAPNSTRTISANDYEFTFDVTKSADPTPEAKCYVGGCSSELCSDTDGMASTCIYREEFACYQTAKCERQSTGQCGWTQTSELNVCLQNAR